MKLKFKPLMLGSAIAVSAALSGCGSDPEQPEITDVFKDVGLWCKSPELVEIASADFYPISTEEQAELDAGKAAAKAQAEADAGGNWTDEEEATWEADFEYEDLDLYALLGLTIEEMARQVVAKEEARAFQIEQGQDAIRGDDFDVWFDTWFDAIPPANYLGPSTRISKSVNSTTPEMDGQEICYTPPLSCPNYLMVDETGTYDCIVPTQNPINGAPPASRIAGAGEAVAYYRNDSHVEGADNSDLYKDMVVHTWNNDDCTAYADESVSPQWGLSPAGIESGIDDNYGMYWVFNLVDEPSNCGNIIFNDTASGKKISDSDLIMPLGTGSDVTLHNVDKNSYADDAFPPNVLDGLLIINQHPFFGAEASSGLKSCGWSMEADASGEQCLGQALVCPVDSVAVGVGAVDIASKCVAVFDPEVTDLFIKGGFNGWSAAEDSQLAYTGNGQYRLNYTYMTEEECTVVAAVEGSDTVEAVEGEDCVDNHDFKVADTDWTEPATFGSIKGGDQSGVGNTITMTVGAGVGQNMKVEMGKDKIYQYLVNASDVAAVTLAISEVPVDAFPMLNIGGESVELAYTSNGEYVTRVTLAAETNSFTIDDPSTEGFALGAVGTDNIVTANAPLALETGGGVLSFTSDAAEYDFILNMMDPMAPTIEIKPAKPFGTTAVFIRGSVNGWGTPAADEVKWDGATRSYSVIYGLEKDGNHAFKFADASWGAVNFGYNEVTISTDADALAVTDDGGNMRVSVAKSTSYKFEVSYATADPVVKVSEAPLYLRGGVTGSGWGADTANQLGFIATDTANTAEASHVYSLEVNYAGGASEFKIADENWGGDYGYNYGSDTPITLGVALPLDNNGSNIKLDVPAGTYIFAFEDGVTKTMTVTAK